MKTERKPRPKQTGTFVGVRVQPDQLGPLDAWIAQQPNPKPSRPEAIRRLLELGLRQEFSGDEGTGALSAEALLKPREDH